MPGPSRDPKLFWNGPNFWLKQNVLDTGQKAKVYFVIQFFDQSKMFWLGPKTLDWSKIISNLEKEEADWIIPRPKQLRVEQNLYSQFLTLATYVLFIGSDGDQKPNC